MSGATMQMLSYYIVLLLALAWFATTMYKRLRALAYARSVDRRGDFWRRVLGVFQHVFGQWRLLGGDRVAGLMHFVIFWGFVILLINSLELLLGGAWCGKYPLPFLGRGELLGDIYRFFRDLAQVLVLVAVGYAFWRRLVSKPKRLELSREALVILGLIALLMIADLVMGGASSAWAMRNLFTGPGYYSIAESLLGGLFLGTNDAALRVVADVAWWVHFVALLLFLNLLPLSKHFHVLLSVFGVYLRKLEPTRELSKTDFEDESIEEFGASSIKHLSWKNWLDAYNCTECGRCDYYCPANSTGKELSPRQIIIGTRDRLYECQPAVLKAVAAAKSGNPDSDAAPADPEADKPELVGGVHTDQQLWACTTCGACDTHCPLFIEHVEPIIEMRRHLVLEQEGRFPSEVTATFKGLEQQGNPWSIGAHQRLGWAEGLEVPCLSERPDAEYIYFAGCMASFDERNKATVRAMVELLNHAGVSFAVLDAETCCGDPARRTGNEYLAQMLIEQNAEQFKAAGVKKVVTACPHCYNTLLHEYHQFGVEFDEVLHHSELLLKLLGEGKFKATGAGANGKRLIYHDSCYLGRYNAIYRQPREVIKHSGVVVQPEAAFHHDKGYCCGAGGGMMFMEETEGTRVNHWRYEQLLDARPDEIAVACPFCMVMLDDAAKDLGGDREKPVRDIAVILRDSALAGAHPEG